MIKNKNIKIIIQRLFIFIILYIILSGTLESLLYKTDFYSFYTKLFILLLFIDIVVHIVYIFKDYGLFKLFVVIQNILFKIMYIVLALIVVYTTYYDDNILSQIFLITVLLGMLSYPLFIIFFLVDTYRGTKVLVDKSLLLILINGVIIYIFGFLVKTEYASDEFNKVFIESFDFGYGMGLIYIPLVVAMIVYVISLFKGKEEVIEK